MDLSALAAPRPSTGALAPATAASVPAVADPRRQRLARLATRRPTALVHLLDARSIRNLGTSSYRLYHTQAPIVVVVYEKLVARRARVSASLSEIRFLRQRGPPRAVRRQQARAEGTR